MVRPQACVGMVFVVGVSQRASARHGRIAQLERNFVSGECSCLGSRVNGECSFPLVSSFLFVLLWWLELPVVGNGEHFAQQTSSAVWLCAGTFPHIYLYPAYG